MERFLFYFFCFLLVWSPIPIGSNRNWSIGLLGMLIGITSCLWLLQNQVGFTRAVQHNKKIIALFFLLPFWQVMQLIPLPVDLLHRVSPNIALFDPDQTWQTISLDRQATIEQLQKSITYALFFVMALLLINTPKRLELTLQVIIFSGVFQACYGVLVTTGGKAFDFLHIHDLNRSHMHSATGTFLNRNHLAGYLEMCLALGIGLLIGHILANKNKLSGWRAITREFLVSLFSGKARLRVFLALMVVALVLSHSRMGNTAFFASMGICGGIGLLLYRKSPNARSLVVLFSSLIVIDMLIVSAWFGLDKLASRLESTTADTEGRAFVFEPTLQAVKDFWLTGYGGGSYYSVFPHYRTNEVFLFYDHAHNDFLELLGDYGVIGFVMFALIVIGCFARAIQAQAQRHTAILKGTGFAAMMGIMSIMIHSSTDFNLQIPANAILFCMLCAFACIAQGMEHQEHGHRRGKSHADD